MGWLHGVRSCASGTKRGVAPPASCSTRRHSPVAPDGVSPRNGAINRLLMDVLGEGRLQRGELDESTAAFNYALELNPCYGRVHADMARQLFGED